MRWLAVFLAGSLPAAAAETQVLPKGVFAFELGYLSTTLDKQWGDRVALPLVEASRRYEPGGGLQGTLSGRPVARYQVLMNQVQYGVTDRLTLAVVVPLVLQTSISTNLSWSPGDHQNQLGRAYSEEDFWQWAGSMGQPRVATQWVGNRFTLGDIVLGGRYHLPESAWMAKHHLRWGASAQVALPTGVNADPEEAVSAGTNLWELHAAGDVEGHLAADKAFFVDGDGLSRLSLGADVFAAWFRPRTYLAGTGAKNPLLTSTASYVGDSYVIAPGGWLGATVSVDVAPFIGPSRASIVSGHSEERAARLPPMVTLSGSYTYVATGQTSWHSESELFDWDHEKSWQPGEKHIFKATLTFSLLRVGVPLQLYAGYRTQDLIPGRYTRPSTVVSAGVRALATFW